VSIEECGKGASWCLSEIKFKLSTWRMLMEDLIHSIAKTINECVRHALSTFVSVCTTFDLWNELLWLQHRLSSYELLG
jgi:hypothetical protein